MPITKRRFVSNVGLSVLQVVVSGVLLFFLYRYLLRHLGSEQLGLWSVLLASTSFARLSEFGLTGSVLKFVAGHRARSQWNAASEVVQTTLLTVGLVMGIVLLASYPLLTLILSSTIPARSMETATQILPYAVLSVWLGALAGVAQSALDGCQQAGYRNVISIGGNAFMVFGAIGLVPQYGLPALAWMQVAQVALVGLVNWSLLRIFMKELPVLPWRWSKLRFREMLSYSLNFQFATVAIMLSDPVTKLLMSKFGGLSAAGYYEMASQLVVRVRTILLSANQTIVPVIAEIQETSPGRLRELYMRAYETVFFVALPVYAGLLLLLPLVSELWIGHVERDFVVFSAILAGSYFLNNLEIPAYLDNLGTGQLRWNSWSHFAMAVLNALLGAMLGYTWGAIGVAVGTSIALLVASGIVLFAVNHKYQVPVERLIPREHRGMAAVIGCVTVAGVSWLAWTQSRGLNNIEINTGMSVLVFLLAYTVICWKHPYRVLLGRLWRSRNA